MALHCVAARDHARPEPEPPQGALGFHDPIFGPWYPAVSTFSSTRWTRFTATGQGDPIFDVSVTGSIFQHISGNLTENAWSNAGSAADPSW